MPSVFYPAYHGELHPESEASLARSAAGGFPPLHSMSPADARKAFVLPEWLGTARKDVTVREAQAGQARLRIYTPAGEGPWPVQVYFHGGGFVLGSLDEFEPFCTFLAADTPCVVVSEGYRLAPEFPFPAALEDAWAGTQWAASNAASFGGDPSRLAVAGDSAGGNLAAGVALRARSHGSPKLIHQTFVCPWVDLSKASEGAESFRLFGEGLWLSAAGVDWFRRLYLREPELAEDPRVSPLRAADLSGLPPALVLLAEFDVLADQGRSFARRLRDSGVSVTESLYPGMLHDFVTLPGLFSTAWKAVEEISASLRGQGRTGAV